MSQQDLFSASEDVFSRESDLLSREPDLESSPEQSLQQTLDYWVEQGAIRALDLAFARFIDRETGGKTPKLLWLALILTSERTGHGHVCLDLSSLFAQPGSQESRSSQQSQSTQQTLLLSSIRNDDAAKKIPQQLNQLLAGGTLTDLLSQLKASPAVCDLLDGADCESMEGAPLVLTGSADKPLLYLRRYWQYEQQVYQGIAQRLEPLPVSANAGKILQQVFGDDASKPDPVKQAPNWQKIACALSARSGFSVITGGPGTGKTTTVVRLLALLQGLQLAEGKAPLVIRLAAPTGKAAARLNESIAGSVQGLNLQSGVLTPEQQSRWQPSIPTEVSTLHRLLGSQPNTRHFRHHRANPLPADIVVVDEASMVDVEMMAKLMDALRPDARLILLGDKDQLASVEAGSVLGDLCQQADGGHYTGDTCAYAAKVTGDEITAQFQQKTDQQTSDSQNPDNALPPLALAISQATTMLRFSYRAKDSEGILKLAEWVNQQQVYQGAGQLQGIFERYEALEQITLAPTELWQQEQAAHSASSGSRTEGHPVWTAPADSRDWKAFNQLVADGYRPYLKQLQEAPPSEPDALKKWVLELFERHKQFQLLCAVRQGEYGIEGLNLRIRRELVSRGLLQNSDQQWYVGRPVLVTQNDYGLKLMNGDIGICIALPEQAGVSAARPFRVAFPDGKGGIRWVLPSRLQSVETVFAMTVHKSQGSEFAHTALILPDKVNAVLTKELLYTGITRSKTRFTLVTPEQSVLERALKQRISRASGLLG